MGNHSKVKKIIINQISIKYNFEDKKWDQNCHGLLKVVEIEISNTREKVMLKLGKKHI